jgi:predicted GTPase
VVPKKRVVIMGAAGRDFHNFNVFFRDNDQYEIMAFTATQIPHISQRTYPPSLAGRLYPDGIPVMAEEELDEIIERDGIDLVIFSYSDVPHVTVMLPEVISCGLVPALHGLSRRNL